MQSEVDILVVDDDEDFCDVLQDVLRSFGYTVAVARSGPAALDFLAGDPLPRLVLLDHMMPDMDGLEVLVRLREHERSRRLPVLFFTAGRDARTIAEAEPLADRVMWKPFPIDDLKAAVAEVLGS